MANETVFKRYHGNPIVTSKAVPRANSIHNSAIVKYGKEYRGIFRVDETDLRFRLHLGKSKDGIRWDIDPKEIKLIKAHPELPSEDLMYDPRLTQIGDTFYFTWCNHSSHGPYIGLATTKDFKSFRYLD